MLQNERAGGQKALLHPVLDASVNSDEESADLQTH
jgi:hypothetical protein